MGESANIDDVDQLDGCVRVDTTLTGCQAMSARVTRDDREQGWWTASYRYAPCPKAT